MQEGLPFETRPANSGRRDSRRSTVPGTLADNVKQPDRSESLLQHDRRSFAKLVADLVIERMETVIKEAVGACKASAGCAVNSGLVIEMDKLLEENPTIEKNKGPNTTKHKKRAIQAEAPRGEQSTLQARATDTGPSLPVGHKEPQQALTATTETHVDLNTATQEQSEPPRFGKARTDGKDPLSPSVTESDGQSKSQDGPPSLKSRSLSPNRKTSTGTSKASDESDQLCAPERKASGNTENSNESPSARDRTWTWARSPKRSKTRESERASTLENLPTVSGLEASSEAGAEGVGVAGPSPEGGAEEISSPGGKSRASNFSSPGAGAEDDVPMQATPSMSMRAQRNPKKAQTVKNIAGDMAHALFEAEELTFASARSCPIGVQDSPKSPKKKGSWWADRGSVGKKVMPEIVGMAAMSSSMAAMSSSQHPAELSDAQRAPPVDFFNINLDPAEQDDGDSENLSDERNFGVAPTQGTSFEPKGSTRYAVSDCGEITEESPAAPEPGYFSMKSTFTGSRPVSAMMSFASAPGAPGSLVSRRISCSVESLRQQRDEHLMELYHIDSGHSEDADKLFGMGNGEMSWWSLILLRICGIIPWCADSHSEDAESWLNIFYHPAAWYKLLVLLTASISLAICLEQVVTAQAATSDSGDDTLFQLGLLSDVPIAVGSILGLLSTGSLLQRKGFNSTYNLLVSYGQREDLLEQWASSSWRDLVATLVVWIFAVAERIRGGGILSSPDRRHVLDLMVFIFTSLLLMGLAFCLLHVCRLLTSMVDAYCVHFVNNPNLNKAVRHWNIIQAMLREACAAIEYCFIVLQTTALAAVLMSVADTMINTNRDAMTGDHLVTLVPGALITLGVARIFYCAAEVTEKCARVPTLINGLFFGKDIDTERQYVVSYIINSAAGFYVFEVRLTSAMALKFAYLSGVAALFVATKVLSRSW